MTDEPREPALDDLLADAERLFRQNTRLTYFSFMTGQRWLEACADLDLDEKRAAERTVQALLNMMTQVGVKWLDDKFRDEGLRMVNRPILEAAYREFLDEERARSHARRTPERSADQ